MSLSAFATLLDFGMVGTIGRSAAYAWGGASSFSARGLPEHAGDTEPNRGLLASLTHVTRVWYYILALVAGLLLMGCGTLFINQRIHEAGLSSEMTYCWLFFSFVTAYSLGTSFWNVLLTGVGDVRNVGRYGVISQIISMILLVAGLLLGLKVWAYAISLFVGPAVDRFLSRKRYLHLLNHSLPSLATRPDFNILAALWPMTWRMGVAILGLFLMQRGNVLIASAFLGLQETARYGLTLNLFGILFQLCGVPLYLANPRIAKAHLQRNIPEVRRLFFVRAYGGLATALVGATVLILFGQQILSLIGSKTSMLPSGFALVLFVILFLDNHQNYYANLVMATNENPFVLPTLLSGICMISLSLLLTPRYGLAGLMLSYGIVQLAFNHWWPVVRGLKTLKPEPTSDSLVMPIP
jgi:O-antigen/teichoic acid export membrane protein